MVKAAALVPELLRNLFDRPVTRAYPFEKTPVPKGFRGTPRFIPDRCTGCRICMRDCPAEAISIEVEVLPNEPDVEGVPVRRPVRKMTMILHLDRCVHCARCAEVCPRQALELDAEFELASFSRDALRIVSK